jgi:hypothetical protein
MADCRSSRRSSDLMSAHCGEVGATAETADVHLQDLAGVADLGHAIFEHARFVIEVDVLGVPVVLGDEAVDGDGDVGRLGGVAGLGPGVAVGVGV